MTPQMTRVFNVLKTYDRPSTKEIEDRAQVAAGRDYIRRLRGKGHNIQTIDGRENGVRVVRYKLHAPAPVAPPGELFGEVG